jgi:hypothetical protein
VVSWPACSAGSAEAETQPTAQLMSLQLFVYTAEEKTKVQRGRVTCSEPHSQQGLELPL